MALRKYEIDAIYNQIKKKIDEKNNSLNVNLDDITKMIDEQYEEVNELNSLEEERKKINVKINNLNNSLKDKLEIHGYYHGTLQDNTIISCKSLCSIDIYPS